tara:strand:+ start:306 stop:524 length:219 start_codon:yes stop_codon:yes gene_type:complete
MHGGKPLTDNCQLHFLAAFKPILILIRHGNERHLLVLNGNTSFLMTDHHNNVDNVQVLMNTSGLIQKSNGYI